MNAKLKILWASDLHLDRVGERTKKRFLAKISDTAFDLALIGGDISNSQRVGDDLASLAQACGQRKCHFVLGNHDFHYSGLDAVDHSIKELCRRTPNLNHLGKGDFYQISDSIGLIGHRGWSDGRAGSGVKTKVKNYGSEKIDDFRGRSHEDTFRYMEQLGRESGHYLKKKLPNALASNNQVLCVTHFPPYHQAAGYGDKPCGYDWQPHFINQSAGLDLLEVKRAYPKPKLTVLCGHTHTKRQVSMWHNIDVKVSEAKLGQPDFEILTF